MSGANPMNATTPPHVGTFAVVRHMLFGMVGLLVIAIAVGLYFGLRTASTATGTGPTLLPVTLAPGQLALGRLDGRPGLGQLGAQFTVSVQRATNGSNGFSIGDQAMNSSVFGGSTSQGMTLLPLNPAAGPLDMEEVLAEFALDLIAALDPSGDSRMLPIPVPSMGYTSVPIGGSPHYTLDFEDVENLIVQYAPPGGSTIHEWHLVEDASGIRFERHLDPTATPTPVSAPASEPTSTGVQAPLSSTPSSP